MTSLDVVPVLLYHRIGASGDRFTVDPAAFRRHVAFLADRLAEGWRAVSVATLGAALRDGSPLPPRVFSVTFDDGLADTAAAIETWGVSASPAPVYAVPSFVGRPGMLMARDLERLSRSWWGEVGAHSLTHPWMDELTPQEAYREALALSARTRAAVIRAIANGSSLGGTKRLDRARARVARARWTLTRTSDAGELGRLFAGSVPRAWSHERLRTRGWRTARRLRRRVAEAIR